MAKCIICEIKFIQKIKDYLIKNNMIDFSFKLKIDSNNAYIPVNNTYNNFFGDVIDYDLDKNEKKEKSLKELLKNELNDDELNAVISSYDVIGDIARVEIPKELENKELLIADMILKSNISLKSVFKKIGIHSGVFRTQEVKFLKGINSKETIHKENGVFLKLDISESFFTPRLATERERIISQIQKNENILVMFSGVGPYPIEISKNSCAKEIYGIEINDNAYLYSVENKNINHANNVFLMKGDVNKIIPLFNYHKLGLKSSIEEIQWKKRIDEDSQIHELHLFFNDIISINEGNQDQIHNLENLQKTITHLKKKCELYIHMPIDDNNKKRITVENSNFDFVIARMYKICKKNNICAIIHIDGEEKQSIDTLKKIKKYSNYFYIENLCNAFLNSSNNFLKVKKFIKNVCIDVAHLKIVLKNNNNEFFKQIIELKNNFNTYFHISDVSNDFIEGKELFSGIIDFNRLFPLINKGILEVINSDEKIGSEALSSKKKLEEFTSFAKLPQFDRILMPLPKTAEEFLEIALLISKNNTIIHLYDFLHENEIKTHPLIKIKKEIDSFNQKYHKNLSFELIETVKCGQYAPRTFRICTDLIIKESENRG